MYTFIIVSLVIIIHNKNNKSNLRFIFITYALSLIVYGLKIIEYYSGNIDFLISDEVWYWMASSDISTIYDNQRLLWNYINYFLFTYDINGNWAVKLINIPIGVSLILTLNKYFNSVIAPEKYIYFLPYILITFTLNLRDNFILLVCIMLIDAITNPSPKKMPLMIGLLFMLYFLRPLFIVLVLVITLFIKYIPQTFKLFSKYNKLSNMLVIISIVTLSVVWYDNLYSLFQRYYLHIQYSFGEGYEKTADLIGYQTSSNIKKDFFVNSLRYIIAPIPISLINRLTQGASVWGYVDELIRILHQTIYYYLMIYVLVNVKLLFKSILSLTKLQTSILAFFLAHLPIYSFYLFGATHQRTKIPFQIAVFIFYYLIILSKKRKNNLVISANAA